MIERQQDEPSVTILDLQNMNLTQFENTVFSIQNVLPLKALAIKIPKHMDNLIRMASFYIPHLDMENQLDIRCDFTARKLYAGIYFEDTHKIKRYYYSSSSVEIISVDNQRYNLTINGQSADWMSRRCSGVMINTDGLIYQITN